MKESTKARWALAAVCVSWGTTYIAIALGVREMPPLLFGSVRFALAGAALLAYCLWRGDRLPSRAELPRLAAVAFMLLTVGNGTLAWAQQWVPAGVASLLVVTTPLWMVGFARAAGESVRPRALAGLLVGFAGLLIVLWPDLRVGEGRGFLWGCAGLLGSSCLWAYGSVYAKRRPFRTAGLMTVALQKLWASLFMLLIGLSRGEAPRWHPNQNAWLCILYLAVVGSIIGYSCYLHALAHLPTEQASIYAYANPVIAVLLGALILGERLDASVAAGGALVIAGVFLVNTARRGSEAAPALKAPSAA